MNALVIHPNTKVQASELNRMGIIDRRAGNPRNVRRKPMRNFFAALSVLLAGLFAVAVYFRSDDSLSRALAEAKYNFPACQSFDVLLKQRGADAVYYAIDSCGEVRRFRIAHNPAL